MNYSSIREMLTASFISNTFIQRSAKTMKFIHNFWFFVFRCPERDLSLVCIDEFQNPKTHEKNEK